MDDRQNRLFAARRILVQRLESLQRAGVEQLGKAAAMKVPLPLGEGAERSDAGEGVRIATQPTETLTPVLSQREREQPPPAALPLSRSSAPSILSPLIQPYPADLPDSVAEREQLLAAVNAEVRACTLCRD